MTLENEARGYFLIKFSEREKEIGVSFSKFSKQLQPTTASSLAAFWQRSSLVLLHLHAPVHGGPTFQQLHLIV